MQKLTFILWALLLATITKGQQNQNYKIGIIPCSEDFEEMTESEKYLNIKREKNLEEKLKLFQESDFFSSDLPELEKQQFIEEETIHLSQKYEDNRSRYFITSFQNDLPQAYEFNNETKILTTMCDCFLSNDTIKINMGYWIFGGFGFQLNIMSTNFNALYWSDMHESPIYKIHQTDNIFTDELELGFKKFELTLTQDPDFIVGENIKGYAVFTTHDYYERTKINNGKLVQKHLKGEIYFKCKIRQKYHNEE